MAPVAASLAALLSLPAGAGAVTSAPGGRMTQRGMASWHVPGNAREARRTASERVWKNDEFVAAHRTLPLGERVRVTNLENDLSVVVEITDRGPYARGRIIDLSLVAAIRLGMVTRGTARVRLETVTDRRNAAAAHHPLFPLDLLALLASTSPRGWLSAARAG